MFHSDLSTLGPEREVSPYGTTRPISPVSPGEGSTCRASGVKVGGSFRLSERARDAMVAALEAMQLPTRSSRCSGTEALPHAVDARQVAPLSG
jgi:hypothetical protein